MDLERLRFSVETSEIKTAVDNLTQLANALQKVKTASTAVSKVKVGDTKSTEQSAKTADNVKKVDVAAEKAQRKLEALNRQVELVGQGFTKTQANGLMQMERVFGAGSAQVKQMESAFKTMAPTVTTVVTEVDKVKIAIDKVTKATTSMEERQRNITEFMTQGFSRGQSSILATAKAAGLAADEIGRIGEQLLVQRRLQGGTPFDNSAQGYLMLTNRLTELKEAHVQYNAQSGLTRSQTRDLARDKDRLVLKMQSEGKTLEQIQVALKQTNDEYVKLATSVNQLTVKEREMERQHRDSINAVRLLANEEEKVDSIVRTLTGSTDQHTKTSERAATAIARYERLLRLSGVSGVEAAGKLEVYRKKIAQIQVTEEARKKSLLSNALAPQISDVVVSLAGGQNPITVALQQGLQVRDLIGQSGVAAKDLQVVFSQAASSMVSSLAMTGKAIGSLFIGSIKSAGASLLDFGTTITGTSILISLMEKRMLKSGEGGKAMFDKLANAAKLAAGVGILAFIAVLATLAKAYKDIIVEESALSVSLNTTGAMLGMTKDEAVKLAYSMEGVTSTKAIAFFTELAKVSPRVLVPMEKLTEVAAKLNSVAGIGFDKIAKDVNELGDKPLDALTKFAIETGRIDVAVLKQIKSLEDQKKTVEAATVAQFAYLAAQEQIAATIEGDLSPLEKVWKDIKSQIGGAWESFKEFAKSDTISTPLKILWQVIAVAASEVWFVVKGIATEVWGLGKQVGALLTLDFDSFSQIGDQMKASAASARSEQDALIARIMGTGTAQKSLGNETKKTGAELQAAARAAQAYQDSLKKIPKTPKTDAEKERAKLLLQAERDIRKINNARNDGIAIEENYTKVQKLALDIFSNENFGKYAEQKRIDIALALEAALAHEAEAEIVKLSNSVKEHSIKLNEEAVKAQSAINDDLLKGNIALQTELETLGLSASELRDYNEAKAQALITTKELAIENLKQVEGNELIIQQLEREVELLKEKGSITAKIEDGRFMADLTRGLKDGVAEAIEIGLFEGGKAGSKKLRDVLQDALRKPFKLILEGVINSISGGIQNSLGGLFGGSEGGSSLSGGSMLSSLKTAFDLVSGGLNAAVGGGQAIANLMAKTVAQFGASTATNLTTQFASGMMSNSSIAGMSQSLSAGGAQFAGAIAGSILNGFSGYGISKALSGGYSAGNGVNTIAGLASMIPGIGPIAGVIGGVFNRAFGRKAPVSTGSGIAGTLNSSSGASVSQYNNMFAKGGWFRSNKSWTEYSSVSGEFDKFLDDSVSSLVLTTKSFATTLGLVPEAIDNISYAINVSLAGLNADQQTSAIEKIFNSFGDVLAQKLISPEFIRQGETAFVTLTRLATSLNTVNSVFDTLNTALLQSSLVGGDAASKLLDVFGGTQAFTDKTSAYYQDFYTEQERVATTTRQLTAVFQSMGMTLPLTREGFRDLVEAQDLMTDEGRATYAALLTLSPAFASITTAIEEFTSGLIDEVRRLRGEILQSSGASGLDYLKSQFTIANAQAKAGDVNALEQLPALSQAVETAAKAQANSSQDIVRIQAWLAQALSDSSTFLGAPVPAFASGGVHTGGARIVGENGPELEITGPSRIFNSEQTSSMMNGNLEGLIKTLNDNITGLRAEVRADVAVNAKTAKLLDRVIPDGDALNITGNIVVDGGEV